MAKGQKPAQDQTPFAKQATEQAYGTMDSYFDYLKRSISSTPSGGTEFGEKLKVYAEKHHRHS
jgi:hypothetical protein